MRAHVVADLGFGDSGKGLLTDYLVRQTGATVVVRYNGGAQAGHNVVTPEGLHHTFAQLGAGSFVGARTWLSAHVVVHPTALLVEARVFAETSGRDGLGGLGISERARIVTPYHQAMNRLRELARGERRHGSCGVGIGETVAHALAHPDEAVVASDLCDPRRLLRKLGCIRDRLAAELAHLGAAEAAWAATPPAARELGLFTRPDVATAWAERAASLAPTVRADAELRRWLDAAPAAVFEGAQGVLLDEDRGFHPHTTWSRCTFANALELLAEHAPDAEVERLGVLRSHAVRHGAGPLPTRTAALDGRIADHNAANDWQGAVRYGWFDAVLARYALDVVGGVDRLMLTHLDLLPKLDELLVCPRYEGRSERLGVPPRSSLEEQAQLTAALGAAQPELERISGGEAAFLARVAELLGRPVDLVSHGPRAGDVGNCSFGGARGTDRWNFGAPEADEI